MDYSKNFTILMPVWNAGNYLDIILKHYAQFDIRPTIIFDTKANDNSETIIRRFRCPIIPADNPTFRSQYIVERGAREVSTSWALRMDDDEVPLKGQLDYIASSVKALPDDAIIGFVRHQCAIRSGILCTSQKHTGTIHRQFRLFQPSHATFTLQDHSTGYTVPEEQRLTAPNSAAMIHLDWTVHSLREREKNRKVRCAHTKSRNGMAGVLSC